MKSRTTTNAMRKCTCHGLWWWWFCSCLDLHFSNKMLATSVLALGAPTSGKSIYLFIEHEYQCGNVYLIWTATWYAKTSQWYTWMWHTQKRSKPNLLFMMIQCKPIILIQYTIKFLNKYIEMVNQCDGFELKKKFRIVGCHQIFQCIDRSKSLWTSHWICQHW